MRRILPLLLFAVLLVPGAVGAQTAIGQVVSLSTKRPLAGVTVALVDDSARVVAVATTDSALGSFFVDAPRAGRYRIALYTVTGASFLSAPMVLDSTPSPQAIYTLPDISDRFAGVRVKGQVTKPAEPLPGTPSPRYPDAMRQSRVRGSVAVAFVIDSTGRPHADSLQVLFSTNPQFVESVKRSLDHARFTPAELDGVRVPQVAQITYAFRFGDDPMPSADVVVTVTGQTRRVEIGTGVMTVPANGGVVDVPSAAAGRPRARPVTTVP
jgi:TonB family protein